MTKTHPLASTTQWCLFALALIAPIALLASAISAAVEHSSLRQHFDGLSRFSSGLANQTGTIGG